MSAEGKSKTIFVPDAIYMATYGANASIKPNGASAAAVTIIHRNAALKPCQSSASLLLNFRDSVTNVGFSTAVTAPPLQTMAEEERRTGARIINNSLNSVNFNLRTSLNSSVNFNPINRPSPRTTISWMNSSTTATFLWISYKP